MNEKISFLLICFLEEKTKVAQETLHRKDNEMQAMEERYKKYIEKAKMVLKTLDPKHNTGLTASPEVAALQAQLREKDRLIESLERETERHRALREAEDQLVTTAFYNLVFIGHHFLDDWMHLYLHSCTKGDATSTSSYGTTSDN